MVHLKTFLVGISLLFAIIPAQAGDSHNATVVQPSSQNQSADCELFPTHGLKPHLGGRLSPLWNYEYVGGDLAREATDAIPGTRRVKLQMVDGGFHLGQINRQALSEKLRKIAETQPQAYSAYLEKSSLSGFVSFDAKESNEYNNHGTEVTNLIVAEPPFGMTSKAEVMSLCPAETNDRYYQSLGTLTCEPGEIVNLCVDVDHLDYPKLKGIAETLRAKAPSLIIVKGAGNANPPVFRQNFNNMAITPLNVGSLSPRGFISSFSREADYDGGVTILAPSDDYVTNPTQSRRDQRFSGTSGAAPLVTGALINAISILGSLSQEEATTLLRQTSVPTANARIPYHRHGAGMLNAYKLVEVAKRLKKADWASGSKEQRLQSLKKTEWYDFSNESAKEGPQIEVLMSEGKRLLGQPSCEDRRAGIKKIRQAFFLSAGVQSSKAAEIFSEAARLLDGAYSSQGYSENAQFYQNFDPRRLETNVAVIASMPAPIRTLAPRSGISGFFANLTGRPAQVILKPPTAKPHPPDERVAAIRTAEALGERAIPVLTDTLQRDPEPTAKYAAAHVASRLAIDGKLPDLEPLRLALMSSDDTLVKIAIKGLEKVPREKLWALVNQALSQNPKWATKVGIAALSTPWALGPDSITILNQLLSDPDSSVQRAAVESLFHLAKLSPGESIASFKEKYLPLIHQALKSQDSHLRTYGTMALGDLYHQEIVRDETGTPYHVSLMRDPDPHVRAMALSALGYVSRPSPHQVAVTLGLVKAGIRDKAPQEIKHFGLFPTMMSLLENAPDAFRELGPDGAKWLRKHFDRTDDYGKKFLTNALRLLDNAPEARSN